MTTSAIYFPYINVPESAWVSQQLLYLERLGSIVPSDFVYNPSLLTPYMRDLVASELVFQVIPQRYPVYRNEFDEGFLHLLKSQRCLLDEKNPKRHQNQFFEIHLEKIGSSLTHELEAMGLLVRKNYPWFIIEKRIGILLMTYIATVLGMSNEINMTPLTNDPAFLKPFRTRKFQYHKQIDAEIIVLDKILPIPNKPIPVNDLVRFKEKYSQLLIPFRREVLSRVSHIDTIKERDHRKYAINELVSDLNEKIEEITRRLEEQRWGEVNLGTICSLASATMPVFEATNSGDLTELYKSIPGLVGAAYIFTKPNGQKMKKLKSEPMAYASFVKKRLHKYYAA